MPAELATDPGSRQASRRVVLLGPQRLRPTLCDAVRDEGLDPTAPIAAVTAGWEEREAEDAELSDHLGGPVINLRVFERAEDVYRRDPELHVAMRARHDLLRELQGLYHVRLHHSLDAARDLLAQAGNPRLLEPEREGAIAAVRALDRAHLQRVRELHDEFEAEWRLGERDAVVSARRAVATDLGAAQALCVAGGHVAILLNRMRVLDVLSLAGDRPIFAWSAGAMALGAQVVLFHDRPAQGPGDAEVLVHGLGAFQGVLPLPHASRRLRLKDPRRVELLARRFAPDRCMALDEGCDLRWDGETWRAASSETRELTVAGAVEERREGR
ncbi:MAG: Type 1 glutamine amidotransferase-like domain-containing protein [Planctomycetota bacterium]